jgi:hypothetical protein
LFAHGRWFSPSILVSSTTKTGRHDIAEILLKVALSTKSLKFLLQFTDSDYLITPLVFSNYLLAHM